jgi:hypothetical protein
MNHEQKIEFIQKTMISSSRQADKKSNRYDPDNFIDKCFSEGLISRFAKLPLLQCRFYLQRKNRYFCDYRAFE